MKTILLPTDFSDNARHAINYAYQLYKDEECRFVLLNTYRAVHAGASMMVSVDDLMLKESRTAIDRLYNELKADWGDDVHLEKKVLYGSLASVVENMENEETIDMIVMGTQGASGLREVLMGSNTAAVIADVSCPVLAVPRDATFAPYKRIALATDYHPLSDGGVLEPLVHLAQRFDADVTIFHVQEDEEVLVEVDEASANIKLHHQLEAIKHTFSYATDEDVVHGINKFIDEHNIQLLTMVAHEHPFFERLFKRSTTKKMAMHTEVPLLALRDDG